MPLLAPMTAPVAALRPAGSEGRKRPRAAAWPDVRYRKPSKAFAKRANGCWACPWITYRRPRAPANAAQFCQRLCAGRSERCARRARCPLPLTGCCRKPSWVRAMSFRSSWSAWSGLSQRFT
jgi:hypothetical protein